MKSCINDVNFIMDLVYYNHILISYLSLKFKMWSNFMTCACKPYFLMLVTIPMCTLSYILVLYVHNIICFPLFMYVYGE